MAEIDTGREILGGRIELPFAIAPTGFTRLMQTDGEVAGARAAARHGIPFALSTLGTASIKEVAAANPRGRKWFQLYMWKDRDRSMELMKRAAEAGFDTLLVSVDVPVAGRPTVRREKRHVDSADADIAHGTGPSIRPSLVVREIQTLDHPRAVAELGVDGLVLSNHGGRQLDRAPVPFHLLPTVARELSSPYEFFWISASCPGRTSSPPWRPALGRRWWTAPTSTD